ncbi:hypothetical protein BDQ17DRAFT_277867 [Cyathus striatus]|nr:hypothetical protein BDQ17DRAFT_277867 [Cyathus striatus]
MTTMSKRDIIIAPREICQSCSSPSGNTYFPNDIKEIIPSLRCNSVPIGTVERQSRLSVIAQTESDIANLNDEIMRLKNSLTALQRHHDGASTFLMEQKSLMAPIRMVPDDLLCHILLLSLTYSRDKGFITVQDRFTSIRVFTEVCFHWRSLVLSYPLLWSHISANVTNSDDSFLGWRYIHMVGMMGFYIEKCVTLSKEVPLCIKIQGDSGLTFGNSCMKTIARNTYRWETIDFGWGFMKTISGHIPKNTTGFNILRSLTLHNDQSQASTISFKPAPALRHFCIKGIQNPFGKLVNFPWTQITHFCARDNPIDGEELLRILKAMPKLTYFEYSGTPMIYTPGKRITLRNLKELKLYNHVGFLLNALDTPGLVSLDLDRCSFGLGVESIPLVVSQFLRQSKCSLQELKLTGISLDDGWDVEELNQLRRLYLEWQLSITRDLRHLTRQTNEAQSLFSRLRTWIVGHYKYLFPQLEALELHMYSHTGYVPDKVVKLLRSRLPSPSISSSADFYLRSANIIFHSTLNTEDLQDVKDFLNSDTVGRSGVDMKIRARYSIDSDLIVTL